MLVGHQGYVPEPYFLTETLRSQSRFHDPMQDSLFSHSGTVQGFRNWTKAAGRSGESPGHTPGTATPAEIELPTLRVRSSRPIGHASELAPDAPTSHHHPKCKLVAEDVYEAKLRSLVTPRSKNPGTGLSKSIRYAILEWNPLLDSSNMDMSDWIRIATEIELNYEYFDAFVVLHGTDTMSYTSSALSFLLETWERRASKSILTGAQIPLSQLRNDATDNLMGALSIAGHYIIPECCLYFNHTLFRGNRVMKVSSNDLSAFDSPNFTPLVKVGIDIVVNWNDVIRQTGLRRFKSHKAFSISQNISDSSSLPRHHWVTIKAFCGEGTRGVRKDVIDALKDACDRGVVIVAISQCMKGAVSDAYETGRTLRQAGVVPGIDMTPEPELSVQEIRELMAIPLRGELTRVSKTAPSTNHETLNQNVDNIQQMLQRFVHLSSRPSSSSTPQIMLTSSEGDVISNPDPQNTRLPASTEACCWWNGNCLESASGRSPLHVAALNGHTDSVRFLLQSGALVHLRDVLGHTALYYAARQKHGSTVDALIQAGATLAGADRRDGIDLSSMELWAKCGVQSP
ncbi:L-asparaginase [Coprinopsis sp. MPI-PUGE-AT-0042]|nr:L-asparaginase [Coprinopsis sp. MPI-PUGE-AT-0042]